MVAQLVGVSLCVEPGKACYIPLIHKARGSDDLFGSDDLAEGQIPLEEALRLLTPMLQDPAILKIGQNMKYDSKIFGQLGINVAPIDDTMLLSYAMHAGLHGHGMDTLSERYLSHTPIPIKPLLGSGKSAITFDKVPLADAVKYAAEDADITLRLWQLFKPQLHRVEVTKVYETLERPLVPVLAAMERSGVKVDRDTLSRMSNAFAQKMAGLEDEIYQLAGRKFNVGSPKQLGEILFDEMALEGGKKGKTGAGWRRPIRTCKTSRSDPKKAAASARPLLPSRVKCWSRWTIPRSSFGFWRILPTSLSSSRPFRTASTFTP